MKKYEIFLFLFVQLWTSKIKDGETKCTSLPYRVTKATNKYGKSRTGNCFQVPVDKLKQIVVHTETCVVRFTFSFVNGTNQSYLERSKGITGNYTVDLNKQEIKGVNLKMGTGVESIQFLLKNSLNESTTLTREIGRSPYGCLAYLNSSFLNSPCLEIDTIYGCVDNNSLPYFPFMAFSYLFSLSTPKTTTTATTTTICKIIFKKGNYLI